MNRPKFRIGVFSPNEIEATIIGEVRRMNAIRTEDMLITAVTSAGLDEIIRIDALLNDKWKPIVKLKKMII
jgi:hypothetical protein